MWILGDIRIYVEDIKDTKAQNVVRLQPVEGGTVHQVFGYTYPIINITGKVIGFTDKEALEDLAETGSSHTLRGYGKIYGSYYIANMSFTRVYSISQTIRPDLDCDAPIFTVDLELYKATA